MRNSRQGLGLACRGTRLKIPHIFACPRRYVRRTSHLGSKRCILSTTVSTSVLLVLSIHRLLFPHDWFRAIPATTPSAEQAWLRCSGKSGSVLPYCMLHVYMLLAHFLLSAQSGGFMFLHLLRIEGNKNYRSIFSRRFFAAEEGRKYRNAWRRDPERKRRGVVHVAQKSMSVIFAAVESRHGMADRVPSLLLYILADAVPADFPLSLLIFPFFFFSTVLFLFRLQFGSYVYLVTRA